MKIFLPFLLVFAVGGLLAPMPASAATTTDVLKALQNAMRIGNSMGRVADKDQQMVLIAQTKAESQKVDEMVAAVEADPATSDALRVKLQEFKTIWADFQKTRDEEIIPAVLAGDIEKVKRLRTVVQVGRIRQMNLLLK